MVRIEHKMLDEYLDHVMLNGMNTIQTNRKRPNVFSIHKYFEKE